MVKLVREKKIGRITVSLFKESVFDGKEDKTKYTVMTQYKNGSVTKLYSFKAAVADQQFNRQVMVNTPFVPSKPTFQSKLVARV